MLAEERLLRLSSVGLGAGVNLEDVFALTGDLDIEALARALRALQARHPVLRSRFYLSSGGARVERCDPSEAPFQITHEKAVTKSDAIAWTRVFVDRQFDLEAEDPWRVAIVEFATQRWLVIVVHHIAHDRWSRDLLRRELGYFYAEACGKGTGRSLAPLALTTINVARWQRSLLAENVGRELEAWWAKELDGVKHAGGLRRRDTVGESSRAIIEHDLRPELGSELRAFANQADVSLFAVFLSAYAALLTEQGSGEDFVVWTPMAGRDDGLVHSLVGYLANVVALRLKLADLPPLGESWIERIRAIIDGAYAHQDLPMQALPGLGEPQLESRSLFAFQNTPDFPLRLSGCEVEPIEIPGGTPDFESFFEISRDGSGYLVRLSYDVGKFDINEIRAALGRFESLLEELCNAGTLSPIRSTVEPIASDVAVPDRSESVASTLLLNLDRKGREERVGIRIRKHLGLAPDSDGEASLQQIGVGSLALLQLLTALERDLGSTLPLSQDLTRISIKTLAQRTVDRVELDTMLRRPLEFDDRGVRVIQL